MTPQEHEHLSHTTTEPKEQPAKSRKAKREKEQVDPQVAAAKRAKAEKIGRTVAMFIMPLLIVGMMIWGYLGAMHHQTAKNMPVVVAGATTSQVNDFVAALEGANPDAVNVSTAGSQMEIRDQVYNREVTAAVYIDGKNTTFFTASAAGPSAATAISAVVTPVILDEGLKLTNEDIVPLPKHDVSGLGAMFLATAMVTAGYMPFSLAFSNSPELLKRRRAIPLLAGWSLLIAGLAVLVTGPIMGIVPGTSILPVLGALALGVFAIGSMQLFFTRIFGSMAVIPGMFVLMVLGQPASNMGMSVYTLPKIFPFLHQFLPMPALGESLRSILYFNGDGAAKHLLILAIGAVVGLLLTTGIDVLKESKGKISTPTEVNVPSLHGGPRPKNKAWRYITLGALPFAMITMMLSFMLGAMHQPTPREMPVAVVGSTMEQAEQTIQGLNQQMEGMFSFTALDNAADGQALVREQKLVGAFVLPSQDNPEATLYTAEAAGSTAAQVVTSVFQQVAGAQGMTLNQENLAPLPQGDNKGTATMYLAMGWIMSGFMVIIVGATAAPHTRPLKNLIPLVAGYSAFMSLVLWLIAGPFTGAIDGHFGALWGVGMVAIFAVAMLTTVFNRLMGMLSLLPVLAIAMFLGVPSSNAALSIYMEPHIFTVLHGILPMPAAVEAIRSILYFDGVGVGEHLITLGLWALICFALVVVIDLLKPVVDFMHPVPEAEIEALKGRKLEAKAVEAAENANEIDEEAQLLSEEAVEAEAVSVTASHLDDEKERELAGL